MIEVIELIKQLPLEGAVVTGDAAITFRSIIDAIRERGGDYFLFVKANQPELEGEIARAFGDVSPSGRKRGRSGLSGARRDPADLARAESGTGRSRLL